MRRFSTFLFSGFVLGFALLVAAQPALAQDIVGISFAATDVMPPGTERGTADILAENGSYLIRADFTRLEDDLVLDDFAGASAWVVWAVDMDGNEHNVGSLDDDLVLSETSVDFLPGALLLSAESSTTTEDRGGDVLFRVDIRSTAQSDDADPTATATAAPSPTAAPADDADDDDAADDPGNLPTTGTPYRDLLVLVFVAAALVVGGVRLRRIRL